MVRQGLRKSITRATFEPLSIEVTDALATTPAIDLEGVSAWAVRSPDSEVASLEVHASTSEDGTYTRVQVDALDLSIALSTNKWNNTEPEVFAFRFVKLVGDAAGTIELVGKG